MLDARLKTKGQREFPNGFSGIIIIIIAKRSGYNPVVLNYSRFVLIGFRGLSQQRDCLGSFKMFALEVGLLRKRCVNV